MIKKIFLIIFFIIFLAQTAFAQEIFRVTSVNFDTSNSLIFLTSPDNTTETIMKNIKLTKLQNPKRIYFDINSAVLVTPVQSWFLNAGGVKQVKISQFSTNPNKIRVVLYLDENFDQAKISFLKVNNNIVIKFKDGMCKEEYFQNTYRDEHKSSSDFYETLSITDESLKNAAAAINSNKNTTEKDEVLSQIQNAFNSKLSTQNNLKPVSVETMSKELKLKSKYYVNSICAKQNGFLISGFGAACIEKPMYLTNPARVVFDIPNAIANPELRDKEFKINQDSVKIGQFEQNKVRVVITSNELEKYLPVFSSDGQSILIINPELFDTTEIFSQTADAVGYYVKKIPPFDDEFIIAFNSPVVHSIRRDNSKLTIIFYNALRYNDQTLKNIIYGTNFSNIQMDLLPKVGLKLNLPLEKDNLVNCYLGADGKSVKITMKSMKQQKNLYSRERTIIFPKINGKSSVVLDAGHGGSEYGAIRCGINEKDINLDIAKRIEAILLSKGIDVEMTRNVDSTVSLEARTTFTSGKNPDIFVSVHVNSSVKPEISGIETHYYHPNSISLAQTVHASMISYVKTIDRGLFKSKFYVINHTTVPAILVEIGFLSNSCERAELVSEERKQLTAQAIAEGILQYLNKK